MPSEARATPSPGPPIPGRFPDTSVLGPGTGRSAAIPGFGRMGPVISAEQAGRLASALRSAGRQWQPASGDRFLVPDRDIDEVFVVSEMTIEVHDLPTGRLIRFNGTTEWALDSISADDVVWLPWEHQLRDLIGDRLDSLQALPGPLGGYAVVLTDGTRHLDTEPERAYLQAALAVLGERD